jgi:hypothetical protein
MFFATVAISSSNLLCHCDHLLFREDISFATVDVSSSKKISLLPLRPSSLQRRYLLCHCGQLSSSKKIYPLPLYPALLIKEVISFATVNDLNL